MSPPRSCAIRDLASRPLMVGCHGWNSSGHYMRAFVRPAMELGMIYYSFEYGWMLAKRFRNRGIAERLTRFANFWATVIGAPTIVIAHSNGAEVALRAAQQTPHIAALVLVNAALDHDASFPNTLRFVHNWYSPGDRAVRVASLIPLSLWGRLGACPYAGPSPRVRNFDKQNGYGPLYSSRSHSDVFDREHLRQYFLPLIVHTAKEAWEKTALQRQTSPGPATSATGSSAS